MSRALQALIADGAGPERRLIAFSRFPLRCVVRGAGVNFNLALGLQLEFSFPVVIGICTQFFLCGVARLLFLVSRQLIALVSRAACEHDVARHFISQIGA